MAANQPEDIRTQILRFGRWIAGGAAALLVLSLGQCSFYTVAEQERAVLVTFGEAQRVVGPGLHFKVPYADSVMKVDTAIQSISQGPTKANTYTIDNQEIDAEFLVVFRIPEDQVMRIYKGVPDYKARLQSLAFDRFKREMGTVNVQDFAQHRGRVAQDTLTMVQQEAKRLYGIEVLDFQISDVTYTKTYREAVEASATAKQLVQKSEQELARAKVDAETAKVTAQGKANAVVTSAEGDSKATKLKGEAEASAIRAQAEALRANPQLVQLRKYEKWDGKLPQSVGLGSAVPFVDVRADRQTKAPAEEP
jgi:regulator of protease activity HflC (stomatin/prohibitin superfamily)